MFRPWQTVWTWHYWVAVEGAYSGPNRDYSLIVVRTGSSVAMRVRPHLTGKVMLGNLKSNRTIFPAW